MMTLDHVGDQEAMVYAQLGQQPLVRTTETSPEPERGTLSCLSARPPDLAFWTGTRPRVVGVSPSIAPFLYSKRTAAARSLVSRMDDRSFCGRFERTTLWTCPEEDSVRGPGISLSLEEYVFLIRKTRHAREGLCN